MSRGCANASAPRRRFVILPPGEKDKKDENFEVILSAVRKARDMNNLPMMIKTRQKRFPSASASIWSCWTNMCFSASSRKRAA